MASQHPTTSSQGPRGPLGRCRLLPLALTALLLAADASAEPTLVMSPTPIGGGLTRYDVDVDFRDGLSRSGFVQVTFQGPFDPSSQLTTINWPDLQQVQTGGSVYMLRGGTGGGSSVDVVEVGQLVVPTGQTFSYNAVISRDGQNFVVVPEPRASSLAAVSLAALALLGSSARRRGAGAGRS